MIYYLIMNILMIDDEKEICDAIEEFLHEINIFQITKAYDGMEAFNLIKINDYDLIICDINLPKLSGIELVDKINGLDRIPPIILISGRDDLIKSINAIDLGILDFLVKPIDTKKLSELIKDIKNSKDKKKIFKDSSVINIYDSENTGDYYYYKKDKCIVASSEAVKNIIKKLKKLREYPEIPVLIEGKSGVGKELIAEFVHYNDQSEELPYIAVNCGSFVETMFESELFGYDKGSFTGADASGKIGKIKLAENGSLFLDEITEISMDMQTKLLRVIQEKEYYKVGGNIKYPVNTRIICATNKNIPKLIKKNLFREDLYYRLNICKITIPTLAERPEDIFPLIIFFIKEFNEKNNFKIVEISKEAVNFLQKHNWPGNIRELKNAIIKALLFNEKKYLSIEDFEFLKINNNWVKEKPLYVKDFILPEAPFNIEEI